MCVRCQAVRLAMSVPQPLPIPSTLGISANVYETLPHLIDLTAGQQRDALAHHQALERSLDQLTASHQHQDTLPTDTLTAMQTHLQGLKEFLGQISQTAIYNEVRSVDSTTAQDVFYVPEILELILSELPLRDLLTMQRVSRYMKTTIDKSSRLQTKLFFRPASTSSPFTAPHPLELTLIAPGFFCEPIDVNGNPSQEVPKELTIKASFYLRAKQTLPLITPNGRRMLICQPPIQEIEVKVECCPQAWTIEGPEEQAVPGVSFPLGPRTHLVCKLQNPLGLTIGDLHDCAKEVTENHRYCVNASYRMLDEYGLVNAGLKFVGKVNVGDDDPVLAALATKKQEAARSEKSMRWARRRVKREYAQAKRTGEY